MIKVMTPLSFTKTTMFHILVIFRSLLLPRAQSMVSRCLKNHKMFLFTTEKPILRWNFFPSSEMVFSRSIWDLKWLLTTRAITSDRKKNSILKLGKWPKMSEKIVFQVVFCFSKELDKTHKQCNNFPFS